MESSEAIANEEGVTIDDGTIRLLGTECADCGRVAFPAREYCPHCGSADVDDQLMESTATLETYSVVNVPPPGIEAPHPMGFVRLEPGNVRAFAPIPTDDPDALDIGMELQLDTFTIDLQDSERTTWAFSPGGA